MVLGVGHCSLEFLCGSVLLVRRIKFLRLTLFVDEGRNLLVGEVADFSLVGALLLHASSVGVLWRALVGLVVMWLCSSIL